VAYYNYFFDKMQAFFARKQQKIRKYRTDYAALRRAVLLSAASPFSIRPGGNAL
jgi:hypothetical protein